MKKLLSCLLLLCLSLSLFSAPVLAEEPVAQTGPAEITDTSDAAAAEAPLVHAEEEPAQSPAESEAEPAHAGAWLGISVIDGEGAGVAVADIIPDSPAAKAGIRVSDLIVGINGEALTNSDELFALTEEIEDGAPFSFSLLRKGSRCTVNVVPGNSDVIGLYILEESAPMGVSVVEVMADSPAALSGMEPEDIIVGFNGETILFVDDLLDAISRCAPGDAVEIELLRGEGRQSVIAILGEATQTAEASALTVTDLPVSVEAAEGSTAVLMSVCATCEPGDDISLVWYKEGKDSISYPIDSFFLPQPAQLGLFVKTVSIEEEGVCISSLCAEDLTVAAAGTYFCRVLDGNGAEIESSRTVLTVR